MCHSDPRHLKTTFNQAAGRYDRARPHYPAPLFDDLVALAGLHPGARILEIGCGTGQATVPMARSGFAITCVEFGDNRVTVARRNLAPYPKTAWHTAGVDSNGAFVLNGSPMAAPYAIAALAVTIALLASVLAALRGGHMRSTED